MKVLLIKNINTSINWRMCKMQWALLMVLLISLSASPDLFAEDFQDKSPLKTRLDLTCLQLPNQQIKVQAKIKAKVDKLYVTVSNAEIAIYSLTDSTEVLLGKVTSDKEGNIELMVNAKDQLSINEDGYYSIMGSFEGDENYESSDDELLFKPAILEMEGEVLDSVKTITIKIYEDSEDATPLEGAEVVLEVPRMFSNLPIASEFTDEDGMVSFKFPNDLPGGENGKLLIMAKVEDTDDYASLRGQLENNWGIPKSITLEYHETRALWSPDAPLWMVFTFALLMTLVWGHFFVIIYKLSLVRKEGKSLADEIAKN